MSEFVLIKIFVMVVFFAGHVIITYIDCLFISKLFNKYFQESLTIQISFKALVSLDFAVFAYKT